MPRGDRTGPAGFGPMTGRAAGFCAGYSVPGYMNPIPGRAGVGSGRGRRNWYYATGLTGRQRAAMGWAPGQPPVPPYTYTPDYPQVTPEQEAGALKEQIKYMEEDIKATKQRIAELEKKEE